MNMNINRRSGLVKRQRGIVLVIALMLLIMITLFAVTAIRSSTTELSIVGNVQLQSELSAAAQEGIETRINSMTDFNNVAIGQSVATASLSTQGGRYTVAVSAPKCIKAARISGNSLTNSNMTMSDITYWEVDATVVDASSGATASVTQGVKTRMPTGSCP